MHDICPDVEDTETLILEEFLVAHQYPEAWGLKIGWQLISQQSLDLVAVLLICHEGGNSQESTAIKIGSSSSWLCLVFGSTKARWSVCVYVCIVPMFLDENLPHSHEWQQDWIKSILQNLNISLYMHMAGEKPGMPFSVVLVKAFILKAVDLPCNAIEGHCIAYMPF